MATFTPQAQQGLDYLKTVNPTLAASIQKSFSPSASTPIDASIIGNSPTISVPPTPTPQIPDFTKVQVSTPAIVNTPPQDALDQEGDQIESEIVAAGDKLATKSARKSTLELDQKIPELNSQLNELNQLIRGVQNEAFSATNKSEDRLAPTFAIRGEQAAIERQRAVKVYGFAAAAEAIQGNIALANDYVTRTIDAEFGHLEQEIENKKFLLSENKDKFSREETRAAETRQVELDKQKEALAQAREDRKSIMEIMLQAAQSGADNSTLAQIQGAKTPEQAISHAGKALGAEFEQRLTQQKFENSLALRNVALDEAKFAYQKFADAEAKKGNLITATTAQDLVGVLGSAKIGQTTKTGIGTIMGVLSAIEDLATSRSEGKFTGFYPGAGVLDYVVPNAFKRASTIENESYLAGVNLKVQQWASGANLSTAQTELAYSMVPKKGDTDATIKTKLNSLTNFMQQQIKGSLLSEGVSYEPEKVDLWPPKSLADIMSPTSTTTSSTK